ncbi:SDR family NAD(P)-dependent oxidoreductase [Mycolicibacterium gadium]|jgi:NAD(P)-dependent dehydrogenase (short-subunit alcohol dehydrogenase family)|uniref:SDR family oxidoreductase n=1 Tax=Mycolicibacterium gadium TaxID=1794 RepID=A0ABT6GRJ3_MYCGU|nr:SDR family oxidoreductase [Mycolicibacterium gadium]MDG5483690.1 SDR family oxidoreductase [Mycolicibacterium gadium]
MTDPGELFDLAGQVAIVTGSTRGLGRAIAEGFSRAGASVVVTSRKQDGCDAVAAEISKATGRDVIGLACHVGDWEAIPGVVEQIVKACGHIDILVNNAGINPTLQSVSTVELDLWRKIFSVNVEGTLRMSQCVAPVMRDGGGGSIVNIGSMEGYAATPISVAYGASKAALRHLTVSMANEWAPWGIRVNILSPGPFATEMITAFEAQQPGTMALLAEGPSQKRVADVSEIVGPALYLASKASSFVTGDDITVSGGMRK